MTKLTKTIKSEMVKYVLDKKFGVIKAELISKLTDLAQEALDARYSTDIKLWLNSAPKGGVSVRGNFNLTLNGDEDRVKHFFLCDDLEAWRRQETADYFGHSFSLKSRPVLDTHRTENNLVVKDTKLIKRIRAVLKSMNVLRVDYDETKYMVESCLSACTTSNKLQELYPSLVKYLPATASATKSIMVPEKDLLKVLP